MTGTHPGKVLDNENTLAQKIKLMKNGLKKTHSKATLEYEN